MDCLCGFKNWKTNSIRHSRVVSKSDYFSGEYSQYLCFSVFCSTNKLVLDRNKHLWAEEQQKTHDLIKSLHDSGMGYRKISHHLNEQGIKTPKGNLWRVIMFIQFLKEIEKDYRD